MNKSSLNKSDIIQYDTRVGHIAAENDEEYLFECFVDNKALSIALDIDDRGMILCGRTGSGKTAIVKYIERNKKSSRIEPVEMAMQYITNSDIIRFLNDIGADLDILFQTIWKHVLAIEYIRLRYGISNSDNSNSWFTKIHERFAYDEKQRRALTYLRTWQSKFWIPMDENIKTISSISYVCIAR